MSLDGYQAKIFQGEIEAALKGDPGFRKVWDAIRRCGHCHRPMGDSEGGFGSYNGVPVCHPNVETRPNCYRNISVYHHEVEDCQDGCQDDPYDRAPVFPRQHGVCEVPEGLPGD